MNESRLDCGHFVGGGVMATLMAICMRLIFNIDVRDYYYGTMMQLLSLQEERMIKFIFCCSSEIIQRTKL